MKEITIEYQHEDTLLEAFIAFEEEGDTKNQALKPGVLIFHAWRGRDDFVCEKARELARLGYVGCALDVYGKGVLGQTKEENMRLMEPLIQDRLKLRNRLLIALNAIKKVSVIDCSQLGSIGFCFGGLCALDLARSGAPIKGIVSFHGLLDSPTGLSQEPISSQVLVLHGHEDPMVTPEDVLEFEKEMTALKVDWQVHTYGNTKHAFTNPLANDPEAGTVYSKVAEKRSWQAMLNFFEAIFHQK